MPVPGLNGVRESFFFLRRFSYFPQKCGGKRKRTRKIYGGEREREREIERERECVCVCERERGGSE